MYLNSNIVEPLYGIELSNELKKNHLYITGSLFEPSGNHHIEAGQCGLPIYLYKVEEQQNIVKTLVFHIKSKILKKK